MPRTYVPLTKCDTHALHPARTACLAHREGNVPRMIVIWDGWQLRSILILLLKIIY